MNVRDFLPFFDTRHSAAPAQHLTLLLACTLLPLSAWSQVGVPAAQASMPAATAPVLLEGITWQTLSKPQQAALAPLEKSWASLNEGQKRKWMAIAKSYPALQPAEQEKLHSRMVEWAALPVKDRELARLNFAQSKTVDKSDRAANWEAYQALNPDQRKELAASSKSKPLGAAVAVKPIAPDKLTPVPVTRHTPEPERAAAAPQRQLNPNTLLPVRPAAVVAPASAAKP